MILVDSTKFLLFVIITGIILTVGECDGAGTGYSRDYIDECKSDATLQVCEQYCYDLYMEYGLTESMKNNMCRRYYNSAQWIGE